jgi:hypothetical protein
MKFNVACGIIRRDKLLKTLKEFKIPLKLIRLVKLTLKHVRSRVKIQNNLSEQFDASIGEDFSCALFNLALQKVV